MKKLVTLFCFLLIAVAFVGAQTMTVHLSGTITADSTGAPVASHEVLITSDSLNGFYYSTSRHTSVNGMYDCTIQNVPTSSAVTFYVRTRDCNDITIEKTFLSTSSPAVVNFVICTQPANCEASFTYSLDSIHPLIYHFYSTSSIPAGTTVSTYNWDFGDNTAHGTTQDPWHTYSLTGTYHVCLTITTSNGCTSTKCQEIQVTQVGCHANYEYQIDSSNILKVHFFNTSSIPVGSTLISHVWSFGDGTANATTSDPWHTFATAGIYQVCLTINSTSGCSSTHCMEIQVGQNECEASFEYKRDSLNLMHFHFFNTSTAPMGTNIISRSWDFGDGTALATTNDPWHTYAVAGEYNVCLTITTSIGCSSTVCKVVHAAVGSLICNSWFTFTQDSLTVNFEGHTNSQYPTTWQWNFGDPASPNNTSDNQTPHHVFTTSGTYYVSLHTINSVGCEHGSGQEITVPKAVYLYGHLYAGNDLVDRAIIQLFIVEPNNVITYVNNWLINDSIHFFQFNEVPEGHYILKAELLPTSVYYEQFAPTYYQEALTWNGATIIELGNPQNPYNFGLKHINGCTTGNGNINGTVTQGGKVNSGGTPVENVEVLLLDAQNNAIAYSITDASGHFEFTGIAYGTYTIWPEIAGLTTNPALISLDANTPAANLPFNITSTAIVYGINDILPESINQVGEIFPNPLVTNNAKILISATKDLTLDLNVYNQMGQKINTTQASILKGKNLVNIDIENLTNGNYLLVIRSSKGGNVIRKFTVSK